jgi:hypothetical protein
MRMLVMVLVIGWAGWCLAASGQPAAGARNGSPQEASYPAVAYRPAWTGTMVGIIAVMFVAALVAGLLVRSVAPEEMPDTHSLDEPPGSIHGHGAHH